ncbi:hypothetical protein HMPREF9162_1229 [Selenomonas sp. oral taxon 137 str. F0430]|nr:hypothetical protein HMPREF9162_1229 [Selenomonas sp. oral taxon 137 str. F0430]EJP28206.1 hypothetical protein HMPREF1147_0310 [Selenomonas sp. FOBRC9]
MTIAFQILFRLDSLGIKKGLPYGAQGIRAAVSEVIIVFQWV